MIYEFLLTLKYACDAKFDFHNLIDLSKKYVLKWIEHELYRCLMFVTLNSRTVLEIEKKKDSINLIIHSV